MEHFCNVHFYLKKLRFYIHRKKIKKALKKNKRREKSRYNIKDRLVYLTLLGFRPIGLLYNFPKL